MNPVIEVGLIAQRELRRIVRSAKGVVMAVLTLLGGIGITLIRMKVEQLNGGEFDPEDVKQIQEGLLSKQYGDRWATTWPPFRHCFSVCSCSRFG